MLESIGEHGYRSTQAANLAHVLYEQGRFTEAAEMIGMSEELGASDDLVNVVLTDEGSERSFSRGRGGPRKLVAMAEEAVAIVRANRLLGQPLDRLREPRRGLPARRTAGRRRSQPSVRRSTCASARAWCQRWSRPARGSDEVSR